MDSSTWCQTQEHYVGLGEAGPCPHCDERCCEGCLDAFHGLGLCDEQAI